MSASKSPANSTRNSRSVEQLLHASPRKMNLVKEKEELRRPNGRFAAYIDKVRSLEEEKVLKRIHGKYSSHIVQSKR